jgi:superfamily II DNA or RNA helicase
VIATTSQLLSTGVDAQTCRVIVLDREVGSMTEFKQIVGRGTRIHEDTRKYYFTLIDFRVGPHGTVVMPPLQEVDVWAVGRVVCAGPSAVRGSGSGVIRPGTSSGR